MYSLKFVNNFLLSSLSFRKQGSGNAFRAVSLIASQFYGFIDQHDGDVIPDFIKKLAGYADQSVSFFTQIKLSPASRACQDIQQFLADCHFLFIPLFLNSNSGDAKKTLKRL